MLKTFRTYNKVVMGIFAFACICLAMSGLGVNFMEQDRDRAALKINDTEVSRQEFYMEKRELEARYRNIFKGNFDQLMQSMNLNLNQEVVEKLTNDILLDQVAAANNMRVGETEIRKVLSEYFPNTAAYAAFLRDQQMTAPQFERKLRGDMARMQLVSVMNDVSLVSKQEVKERIKEEERQYALEYAEFKDSEFVVKVAAPDEKDLKALFEQTSSTYQLPPRVSYDYVVLSPDDFMSEVQVDKETLEFEYAENQAKFTAPEQVRARHIVMLFPKEADPEKMAALTKRAEEAHTKAAANEPFEKLVLDYSDDITTKAIGGDIGWVKRGEKSKEFDEAVFKLKGPGVAELISTDKGYEIVRIEEYQESKVKEFEAVKADIEKELRAQEAPAYASAKAAELLQKWKTGSGSLKDLAEQNKLVLKSSDGLLVERSDPEGMAGLTSKVMAPPTDDKQLIEMGSRSVLVGVKEFKDVEQQGFDTVKDKVLDEYKKRKSSELARAAASDLLKTLKEDAAADFAAKAKAAGGEFKEEKEYSKKKPGGGILGQPDVANEVLVTSKENTLLDRVFSAGNTFAVVKVKSIKEAAPEVIEAKAATEAEQKASENGQLLVSALINHRKSQAVIEPDRTLLE